MARFRKKLIEVALPLVEINDASAYDKMPGIGPHPKGIHHWWARLPLPTARAILFASVLDDPSEQPERFPTEAAQDAERERLFGIIRRMMQKKLHARPEVYAEARAEITKHCAGNIPTVLDPFAGGGSIPLEAHRLGLAAHACDLNPVAVLLNKCNLELVPRWANQSPVNPEDRINIGGATGWKGSTGLAADIRYYGKRIGDALKSKFGKHYPKAQLSAEHGGGELPVVAWLWARTVASDNPAAHGAHVPLVSTYWLSTADKKKTWLEPVVNKALGTYSLAVSSGTPMDAVKIGSGTKIGRGGKFECILTGTPIKNAHVKGQGVAGQIGFKLLAIIAAMKGGKIYLPATECHEAAAHVAPPEDAPNEPLRENARYLTPTIYGMRTMDALFTPRQLCSLVELSRLIRETSTSILLDATSCGLPKNDANYYASTVVTFLALALDRCTDFNNACCRWSPSNQKVMNLFGRPAIPMIWDFAEANILADSVGGWATCSKYVAECVEVLGVDAAQKSVASQIDAAAGGNDISDLLVSTDPPYYDNIPYADISDFFYVWLRRSIGDLYPEVFGTVLVPKAQELTAAPERFEGDKDKAKEHFESGFRKVFTSLRERLDLRFPLTVYYAFKQENEDEEGDEDGGGQKTDLTTGWETLLEALISSGFQITATWPVRASQGWRMRSMGANALASYIVLACRPRPTDAAFATRREFLHAMKQELPAALRHLQHGNIAPVDLAQATIGPGMAVFTRYAKVMEADGSPMKVRQALALINQTLDEVLAEQEGEFDGDTRWALAWFEQFGTEEGQFGEAEILSKAKNTAVNGLVEAGIVHSRAGKVRLLKREELSADWNPATETRLRHWEIVQYLIRALETGGETAAADLLRKLPGAAETARDLAYRLFSLCERKKWAQDALAYNSLVIAWTEISTLARSAPTQVGAQGEMFGGASA